MHSRSFPLARFALVVCCLSPQVACQSYKFREVLPVPVAISHSEATIAANPGTPYFMIVQDTSYSMCEPIEQGVALVTAPDAGEATGYCSADPSQSKMGITATAMQTVLAGLDPKAYPFFLGLTQFPDPMRAGCAVVSAPVVPIGDAGETLPEILTFYQQIIGNETGGTPTAATFQGPVATALSGYTGNVRRYVLLITDGLPNCNDRHPCVWNTAQYAWSDGLAHGCESPNYLAQFYTPPDGGMAEPPAACICAQGNCPDPTGPSAANTCCPANPLQTNNQGQLDNQATAAGECLDDDNTVQTILDLNKQGITTYVVGMGFDFSNGGVLDRMAQAGQGQLGNPAITHYQANNGAQLLAALQEIIYNSLRACLYTLDRAPEDPRLIDVTLDSQTLVLGDPNGFEYVAPDGGSAAIQLVGKACDLLQDGHTHDLSVVAVAE
jgi:hypothetical protein